MNEKLLIDTLKSADDLSLRALILQTYIQAYGPVSSETGDIIKTLLAGK